MRVYAYEKGDTPAFSLTVADVSQDWQSAPLEATTYDLHRGRYPRLYELTLPEDRAEDYALVAFRDAAAIVRIEVDYADR